METSKASETIFCAPLMNDHLARRGNALIQDLAAAISSTVPFSTSYSNNPHTRRAGPFWLVKKRTARAFCQAGARRALRAPARDSGALERFTPRGKSDKEPGEAAGIVPGDMVRC